MITSTILIITSPKLTFTVTSNFPMTSPAVDQENIPPMDATNTTATEPAAKGGKTKKAKEVKAKAKKKPTAAAAAKKKSVSTHPTYEEMIKDAIVSLKERTGSSQYAIQKFIEEKHKVLSPSFRKLLLLNLKRLVASEKLVKVKASFKIPSAKPSSSPKAVTEKKKPAAAAAVKPKAKGKKVTAAAAAKKSAAVKPKPKAKATVAPKRKAVAAAAKPKAKAAKTSTVTSPGKKAAAAKKKATKVATKKKTPVKKAVKPKTVKSPAKRASKRGVK
ncbi:histone H1.1-like [Brassica napus]|nr:histone H1.1-like [Brassica napus]